jgi:hypothetical protein
MGSKSGDCPLVIVAPWPPLRRRRGIHRRTAGLLARGVSPTPPSRTWIKSSGEKSVGTPLTVAGAATDRLKAYRVPFSPSSKIEGPYGFHVPASAGVVKCGAALVSAHCENGHDPADSRKAKMIKRKAARDAEVSPAP